MYSVVRGAAVSGYSNVICGFERGNMLLHIWIRVFTYAWTVMQIIELSCGCLPSELKLFHCLW